MFVLGMGLVMSTGEYNLFASVGRFQFLSGILVSCLIGRWSCLSGGRGLYIMIA